MGNLHIVVVSGATALDLLFGGLTATPNSQYRRRKIYLCGHHRSNYFARLVPEMGLFSKISKQKLIISIRILLLYYS